MLFNSLDFLAFFAVVLALYFALPFRFQNMMLLAASYVFYGWWDWRYLGLILLSSVTDFTVGRMLTRTEDPGTRKRWLLGSLTVNLGVLCMFKYFDFFTVSTTNMLHSFGISVPPLLLHLVLPVGVSFYTFQSMSYSMDVYFRRTQATRSLLNYLLFHSFFPQLIAGPISRANDLLVQLERPRTPNPSLAYSGAMLMLWGIFKKVAVADNLAPYVDVVYTNPAHYSGVSLALASYLFSFQIYCDFSGYSDMAVGMARILGVELVFNFRTPYFSQDIREFWRRWHVSLSSWFRDYLYIPLGGNRSGKGRDLFNLMTVFLVSGLWHGANWTYVIWGGLHGLYMACYRLVGGIREQAGWRRWVNIVITFNLATFAWIFFRSATPAVAWDVIRGLVRPGRMFSSPLLANGLVALALLLAVEIAKEPLQTDVWLERRSPRFHLAFGLVLVLGLALFGAQQGVQFIYFQF